ncbi:MAG: FlgD immunoglobulin-like domain containing protein, partial [candidate division WOR-3 bacterium]
FRSHLVIRYTLDAERLTLIEVHDLTGRVVRRLVNSRQKPGHYTLSWNGTDMLGRRVANGVYFCRMVAGDYRATRKVVLER